MVAYTRMRAPEQPVHIYIEGDGLAWLSRTRLSADPTPRRAQGLELAASDQAANVVYLARPCQFVDPVRDPCSSAYWSDLRFSDEVIRSMNEAVDTLAPRTAARGIHLVGYSGGAAVAALMADRRKDVVSLRTVAGNLAVDALNDHHRVTPMPESLDPIAVAQRLADLPQIHFVGSGDTVVPPFVGRAFARQTGDSCARVVEIADATHATGWTERWTDLMRLTPRCTAARIGYPVTPMASSVGLPALLAVHQRVD